MSQLFFKLIVGYFQGKNTWLLPARYSDWEGATCAAGHNSLESSLLTSSGQPGQLSFTQTFNYPYISAQRFLYVNKDVDWNIFCLKSQLVFQHALVASGSEFVINSEFYQSS